MEEEIVDAESEVKQQKLGGEDETERRPSSSTSEGITTAKVSVVTPVAKKVSTNESWKKSVGGLSKKGPLVGLVKVKKSQNGDGESSSNAAGKMEEKKNDAAALSQSNAENKLAANGLSLLGAYSDSESSD